MSVLEQELERIRVAFFRTRTRLCPGFNAKTSAITG